MDADKKLFGTKKQSFQRFLAMKGMNFVVGCRHDLNLVIVRRTLTKTQEITE